MICVQHTRVLWTSQREPTFRVKHGGTHGNHRTPGDRSLNLWPVFPDPSQTDTVQPVNSRLSFRPLGFMKTHSAWCCWGGTLSLSLSPSCSLQLQCARHLCTVKDVHRDSFFNSICLCFIIIICENIRRLVEVSHKQTCKDFSWFGKERETVTYLFWIFAATAVRGGACICRLRGAFQQTCSGTDEEDFRNEAKVIRVAWCEVHNVGEVT